MIYKAELYYKIPCALGEGPVWDGQNGALYWIDGLGNRWHCLNADGSLDSFDTPCAIGALVLSKDGGAVMSLQDGIYRLDIHSGKLELLVNPEADVTGNRFNDAKADPKGRLVVGSMSTLANDGGDAPRVGQLYTINAKGEYTPILGGIGISNGLDWSADGKTLYYVDSLTGGIQRFDYDIETGSVANGCFCARIPEEEGIPDGMCIDAEGMLWVAQWGGWCVSRWNPATGECLSKVEVPVKHVTCCAFGGEKLDKLFITTSTSGVEGSEWSNQPLAGSVFVADVGVCGSRVYRFDGGEKQ